MRKHHGTLVLTPRPVRRSRARVIGLMWRTSMLGMAGACAVRPSSSYDVFLVPGGVFRDSVARVVLAPVVLQTDVAVPETILQRIDSLIAGELSASGFEVVPAVVYEEIWMRLNEEAGGFFDPYTGERDEGRFQEAVDQLKLELQEAFDPDALVYPEIWPVEVPVSYGTASWDGVKQAAFGVRDVILALSLVVVIEDMEGRELFVNGGGLEVVEMWSRALGVVRRPTRDMFGDDKRIVDAVEIALHPLLENRRGRAGSVQ